MESYGTLHQYLHEDDKSLLELRNGKLCYKPAVLA